MSSDYPPLPQAGDPKVPGHEQILSSQVLSANTVSPSKISASDKSKPDTLIVICHGGDLIIEYTELSSGTSRRWRVHSQPLMRNSPYFQVMLDPNKFAEGRLLAHHKQKQAQHSKLASNSDHGVEDDAEDHELYDPPTVRLAESPMTKLCGADAIGVFLKILCLDVQSVGTREAFQSELKAMSASLIERTIEIAESFSSSSVVGTLKASYTFNKSTKVTLRQFSTNLLKWSEDRVRQTLVIANTFREAQIARIMMHTLIVMGSKYWVNGPEVPSTPYLRWRYLAHGIEEELYYRRQRIMNAITDVQAYFLRIYGALEETHVAKPTHSHRGFALGAAFSTSHPTPQFQCRAGFENGSQCDLFHLGQMTRFFALRAKTIFLGSTLIDPDISIDDNDHDMNEHDGAQASSTNPPTQTSTHQTTPSGPPSDLTAIFASLKQYPNYQIDNNHQACGVRRRFLPVLACLEKFILDHRGLLGIDMERWENPQSRGVIEWRVAPKDHIVDIRFEKIVAIQMPLVTARDRSSQEDDARLLFTATKYNWEA